MIDVIIEIVVDLLAALARRPLVALILLILIAVILWVVLT
jgi:hypothetical protein